MAFVGFAYAAVAVGGGPESGALHNVYRKGTSTRVPAYTDSGLTTPDQNPAVSDADDRKVLYLDTDEDYTIRATTANAATRLLEVDVAGGFFSVRYISESQVTVGEPDAVFQSRFTPSRNVLAIPPPAIRF